MVWDVRLLCSAVLRRPLVHIPLAMNLPFVVNVMRLGGLGLGPAHIRCVAPALVPVIELTGADTIIGRLSG